MMRGLLSNEEEIVRGILMANLPLLLRLLFSECIFSESRPIKINMRISHLETTITHKVKVRPRLFYCAHKNHSINL